MRRIIPLLALVLASSPVHASPLLPGDLFTPDTVFVAITGPVFGNGTNTFCWQCGDAIPSNDLQLVLHGRPPFEVLGYPDFFTADSLGLISVSGPADNFDGLDVSFAFRVTTTVTTKVNPDGSLEPLPRPSVTKGSLTGGVLGIEGRDLVLRYSGRVNGVTFLESSTDPFTVPLEGGDKLFTSEIFVDEQIPYAPSVLPEPTSLLLLGSALAAAAFRVKKAAHRRA